MRRWLLSAKGFIVNTLTSKNVLWCRSPQKPSALTSRRAPSWILDVKLVRDSPDRGCSSGSVDTLGHISISSCATKSLSSLCLKDGYPPRLQLRA